MGTEVLAGLSPLFTAGIFFVAVLALLLQGMKAMLNASIEPIKEQLSRLEKGQEKIENELKADIKALKKAVQSSS